MSYSTRRAKRRFCDWRKHSVHVIAKRRAMVVAAAEMAAATICRSVALARGDFAEAMSATLRQVAAEAKYREIRATTAARGWRFVSEKDMRAAIARGDAIRLSLTP